MASAVTRSGLRRRVPLRIGRRLGKVISKKYQLYRLKRADTHKPSLRIALGSMRAAVNGSRVLKFMLGERMRERKTA
jgi:hypothetical protein